MMYTHTGISVMDLFCNSMMLHVFLGKVPIRIKSVTSRRHARVTASRESTFPGKSYVEDSYAPHKKNNDTIKIQSLCSNNPPPCKKTGHTGTCHVGAFLRNVYIMLRNICTHMLNLQG